MLGVRARHHGKMAHQSNLLPNKENMTNLRRLSASALISSACFGAAYAQTALVPSNDLYQCGSWIEARKDSGSSRASIMIVWTWGYVSGIAHADPRFKSIDLPNGSSISAWMDKYCRENPLKNIVLGSADLMEELAPKKAR